jgi:hypothetical protein
MKVSRAIEMLKEYDEDYELVFSDYTMVIIPDVESGEPENYVVITDDPITGIVESHDTKEIRFCSERSEKMLNQEQVDYTRLN